MIQNLHDFKLGTGLATFCLFLLLFIIPNQVGSLTDSDALMPVIITVFILVLSIVLIFNSIRNSGEIELHNTIENKMPAYTLWVVVGVMIGHAWLLDLTGYLLTSIVAMITLFCVFGVRNFKRIVLITAITLGLLYISFEKLLYAPLPVGSLIEKIIG